MKPITISYPISVGARDPVRINANSGVVQLALQTLFSVGATPTYTIEGNLGIIDTDLNDWTTKLGQVVPDPNGWIPISGSSPLTAATFLGYQDLAKYLPLSFVRVNISAGSSGTLTFKALQQAIV